MCLEEKKNAFYLNFGIDAQFSFFICTQYYVCKLTSSHVPLMTAKYFLKSLSNHALE